MARQYRVSDLVKLMAALRDDTSGCPWDRKQNFKTIVPHTLEETYEVIDAIERNALGDLEEELGDLLFQVIFYAQLGDEIGEFDFASVVDKLAAKLIRRHPHVFPHGILENLGAGRALVSKKSVMDNWDEIKKKERASHGVVNADHSALANIPTPLTALIRAQKLQKRAALENFDWTSPDPIFDKLQEEITELKTAIADADDPAIEDELGDIIFTCVNLARHLHVDAEQTLRGANKKFERRFRKMEENALHTDKDFSALTEQEMNAMWDKVKIGENSDP